MKKIMQIVFLFSLLSFLSFGKVDVDMYPKTPKGWEKHVFLFEAKDKEEDFRVELSFRKDVLVDCNQYFFLGGKLEEKVVEGWGYPYYEFSGKDDMAGTRMACPNEEKTKKRVYYSDGSKMLNYNSKLPLVIYAPKEVKIEVYLWNKIAKISSR